MRISKELVIIVAIVAITSIQLEAFTMGVNGKVFAFSTSLISGLGGFSFGLYKKKGDK